jgi:hypothetical protein
MAQENNQEGYWRDGRFYKSPEEEIRSHYGAMEFSQDGVDIYETGWKWLGKPGFLYSGLRLLGLVGGIGPEIDAVEPAMLDGLAGIFVFMGSICKFCSSLAYLDVRSSKKDLEEATKRLGFNNSAVEKIVAENSQ